MTVAISCPFFDIGDIIRVPRRFVNCAGKIFCLQLVLQRPSVFTIPLVQCVPEHIRALCKEAHNAHFTRRNLNTESGLNGIDSFDQLLRRLTLVIYMNSDAIEVVTYNFYGFQFVPGTVKQNPYSAKNRPAPKVDRMGIYRSMLDSASPVTDSSQKNEITATAVAAPLKNQNEGGGYGDPSRPKESG